MPVLKCQNLKCDYFKKPVPEGEFCPFCGEPIGQLGLSNPAISSLHQNEVKPPVYPSTPAPFTPPTESNKEPNRNPRPISAPTVVEGSIPPPTLKMIHNSGQQFIVSGRKSYIGRQGGKEIYNPEIDLSDIPYAARISRPHACIYWDESSQKYMITDENSVNGTILNGQSLKPHNSYSLKNGDVLQLGREQKITFSLYIE